MAAKTEETPKRGRGRPRGHSGAAEREHILAALLDAFGPMSRNALADALTILHGLQQGGVARDRALRLLPDLKERREVTNKLRTVMASLSLAEHQYLKTRDPAPHSQVWLALDRLRKDGRVRKCADTAGADTLWMLREQTCP